MEPASTGRPFDIAVYGATGFTGRQTAKILWKAAQTHGLKMVLAGRSQDKLHELRRTLGPEAEGRISLFVADCHDESALGQLASSTRVLVNNAGPYTKYGPCVVGACVNTNTDYVDITGETPFVRKIIDLHHERARQRGVRIVPFCGFDSVPSEYSVFYALREWARNFPHEPCEAITTYFEVRGGLNGGTIESAFTLASEGQIQLIQDDLTLLCPKGKSLPSAPADWTGPRKIDALHGWSAPFFMSPVNTRVVRRSQSLFSEVAVQPRCARWTDIAYEEGLLLRGPLAPLAALTLSTGMRIFSKTSWIRATSGLIRRALPRPGEGPSEAQMNSGFMRLTTLARGKNGTLQTTRLKADGDPGNRITVACLTQAALCLALFQDRNRLPARFGVLTPAFAFDEVLFQRLQAQNFVFELLN